MRFIKKAGKLAKFVIYICRMQDVGGARPWSALLAATREGNLVSPPSYANSEQPAWASPFLRSIGSQCPWTLAM